MNPSDSVPRRRQGMDYGESEDVQKVHAAIQREKQEPRVGLEPLSLWLIGIYALAIFLGAAKENREGVDSDQPEGKRLQSHTRFLFFPLNGSVHFLHILALAIIHSLPLPRGVYWPVPF